ncbi:uncharacterized protein TrAtP1_008301 [Trichoderma atroviride]|uniref:uncharacterized protein n=1 Tax=Hypocrea atroviridis TaxID=63577 RepID=UPI003331015C|nr:hypothetical protein TrAtP1_008301 [Trichoderma atroviride]
MPRDALANGRSHKLHTPPLPGKPSRQARHLRFAPSASAAPPMASHRFHRDCEEEWRQGASFFCIDARNLLQREEGKVRRDAPGSGLGRVLAIIGRCQVHAEKSPFI